MNEITLAIIKPDAYKNGSAGKIIDRIISEGFTINNMKQIHLTKKSAEEFYEVHKERPFFNELTSFMSSGKSIVISIESNNAISKWREIIGSTNPKEAKEGTIRAQFGANTQNNAVHGSDSPENGILETNYFF